MKEKLKINIPADYRRKLNGYRCCHRNKWLLISNGILSLPALSLLEFYIDISDFDIKHLSFGTLKVRFEKIALVFRCSSNTIRNWHNELIKAELVYPSEDRDIYQLKIPKRYIAPGTWKGEASNYAKVEKDQPAENIFQIMRNGIQEIVINPQPIGRKTVAQVKNGDSIALGSSKVSSGLNEGKGQLTEEDKEWLKAMY